MLSSPNEKMNVPIKITKTTSASNHLSKILPEKYFAKKSDLNILDKMGFGFLRIYSKDDYLFQKGRLGFRLRKIIKYSTGYLYYVSIKGITGSSIIDFKPIKKSVDHIRKLSRGSIPVTVGFGIKNGITAKNIGKFSDGIIIGSSIVELVEKYMDNRATMYKKIKSFLVSINKSIGEKWAG